MFFLKQKDTIAESGSKSYYYKVNKKWTDFASTTSVHGINHLLLSKSLIKKFLWTFVILFCLITTLYIFISNVADFLKHDVINQVKTIYKNTSVFPAIIFCSTKLQYKLVDLVKSCSFNQETCNFTTNFDLFIENEDRNCLRFNGYIDESEKLKITNGIGYLHGLSITFSLPKDYDGIRVYIVDNYINTIENEIDFFFR